MIACVGIIQDPLTSQSHTPHKARFIKRLQYILDGCKGHFCRASPELYMQTCCIDMSSSIFKKGVGNSKPLPCGAHAMYRQVRRHFVIIDQEFTASSTRSIDVRRVMIWRLIKAAMNTAVMIRMIVGAGALSRKKLA